MDNYTNDSKLYDNMVKTKKTYEQFDKTDDEVILEHVNIWRLIRIPKIYTIRLENL